MKIKLILFIVAVAFIVGSLFIAIWYRMKEDRNEDNPQ
tara:strand:- start:1495 stop:1608 length:114 start_codon:yes stop_codon:yes gene_type:complete